MITAENFLYYEYAHLISSGIDHDATLVDQMHRQILSAMNIHTTQYGIDTYRDFQL